VGSLDRYSNCQGHKDEDEDKMNLHGLSRRSSAFDEAVPADVLSAALHDRFRSYEEHTFAQKVLSPTRQGFGGHNEAKSHGSNRMEDKA
jgi:6-phosphogluconate dehydrogenase (decarboxylating)